MSRHRADGAARARRVALLASRGHSDAEIAALCGLPTPAVVQAVRKRHGIPAGWNQRNVPAVEPAPTVEKVTIDGVTYCPPRWAEGAEQDHRVKPCKK